MCCVLRGVRRGGAAGRSLVRVVERGDSAVRADGAAMETTGGVATVHADAGARAPVLVVLARVAAGDALVRGARVAAHAAEIVRVEDVGALQTRHRGGGGRRGGGEGEGLRTAVGGGVVVRRGGWQQLRGRGERSRGRRQCCSTG